MRHADEKVTNNKMIPVIWPSCSTTGVGVEVYHRKEKKNTLSARQNLWQGRETPELPRWTFQIIGNHHHSSAALEPCDLNISLVYRWQCHYAIIYNEFGYY